MNRRNFLTMLGLGAAAAVLPLTAKPAQTDEYDDFLARVQTRVQEIVRREGRGLHTTSKHTLPMWIDPPEARGNVFVRKVHVMLKPGGSLLQKLHFEFEEVSGSRLVW